MQPIEITISTTTNEWIDPTLAGKVYSIVRRGTGPLRNDEFEFIDLGGFRLLSGEFAAGETLFLYVNGYTYSQSSLSYSNGYNLDKVMAAMMGRIGWKPSTSPTITSENATSKSGRYFNDFHAVCSVKNLYEVQENETLSDSAFNDYLQGLYKSVIARTVNGVLNDAEYLEQVLLYDRCEGQEQVIDNDGKFVGYEITLPQSVDVAVQISSMVLYFDTVKTFNIYLYKDGVKLPIWTKEVTTEAGSQTIIPVDDVVLSYMGNTHKGSRFFIGYDQTDLGATKAIREPVRRNKTKCFSARSIECVTFDQLSYTDVNGLNLEVNSFRDHTDQVVKKAHLFDEAIGLQMAYNVIEQIVYSTRSNSKERILNDSVKMNLLMELQGTIPISDAPATTGLNKRIEREINRVKKGFVKSPKAQTVSLC